MQSATDIAVKSVRVLAPATAIAGTHDEYYVVKLAFTNDLGATVVPQIAHFQLVDVAERRYFGTDSGDAALVGISNSRDPLGRGETRDYTVGFRVPVDTIGTVVYDASF